MSIKSFFALVNSPTTVGSKSTKTARGTCFPAPVSLKNVLKESSPPPIVLSLGIWPSGWIPCSKQYNSQQALPIWTPAWPTCTEIHSRWMRMKDENYKKDSFGRPNKVLRWRNFYAIFWKLCKPHCKVTARICSRFVTINRELDSTRPPYWRRSKISPLFS